MEFIFLRNLYYIRPGSISHWNTNNLLDILHEKNLLNLFIQRVQKEGVKFMGCLWLVILKFEENIDGLEVSLYLSV